MYHQQKYDLLLTIPGTCGQTMLFLLFVEVRQIRRYNDMLMLICRDVGEINPGYAGKGGAKVNLKSKNLELEKRIYSNFI